LTLSVGSVVESLSVMVMTPVPSAMVAPVGLERLKLKLSVDSNTVSLMVATETVFEVSPVAKFRVPVSEV